MESRELAAVGVIVALLLGAIILIATSPQPMNGNRGPPPCPCLAVSAPLESSTGAGNLYNFTIEAVGGGPTWDGITFEVDTPSGGIVPTFEPGWNLTVRAETGALAAIYNTQSTTGGWTLGGPSQVSVGQSILLASPPNASLGGDSLTISFTPSGSIVVGIP